MEGLARAIRQRKKGKEGGGGGREEGKKGQRERRREGRKKEREEGRKTRKKYFKEVQLFLTADDMIICIENPKEPSYPPPTKLLEINKFFSFWLLDQYTKVFVCLYDINDQSEKKLRKQNHLQ